MKQFTPEQRKAFAAKSVATRKANREKREAEQKLMELHANKLYQHIRFLEEKLAKLETHDAMQTLSDKISGKSLLRHDQIIELAMPWQASSGVYFLIDVDRVVYVGQSVNVYSRIPQHYTKKFDKYAYVPCTNQQLNVLESLYIHLLQPKFNRDENGRIFAPLSLQKLLTEMTGYDVALPTVPKPKRQRYESAEVQP
jgi:hypothetical protein